MKNYNAELDKFYNFEIPEYVVKAGKTFIELNVSGWSSYSGKFQTPEDIVKLKITMADVIRYYKEQANSMSGMRIIAGFAGDWRYIDNMAQMSLGWFKFVNVDGLRKFSLQNGLSPKF
jgi:hypothetical protein